MPEFMRSQVGMGFSPRSALAENRSRMFIPRENEVNPHQDPLAFPNLIHETATGDGAKAIPSR